MGFTFDAITAQLRDPGDGVFRNVEWLTQSIKKPARFATALLEYHASLDAAPIKSSVKQGYDFYHDLILRHVATDRAAACWLDNAQRLRRITYADLHARCTNRRAQWLARGVAAGQRICVLASLTSDLEEFLVPLCTALRMGLQVSLLPPAGSDFLSRRLRKLSPHWIATAERYRTLLRSLEIQDGLLIAEQPGSPLGASREDATSHIYEGEDVVLQIFSPATIPPHQPVEVKATEAYQGALRDGVLLLGLHPGQVVAEAEQSPLRMVPALLLATMLRGATFLHLSPSYFESDVRRDDPLAQLPPIDVLFVDAALRTAMLQAPPRQSWQSLQLFVINAQEPAAPNEWSDWVQRFGLQGAAAMALIFDAACGGSVLFSLRRFGGPAPYLMPVPGRRFELLAPDDSDAPARGSYGMCVPRSDSVALLLSRVDGGYLYAGTRSPTDSGQVYPKIEVEDSVRDLEFVRGASVVSEPGESGGSTLLIFTGPETREYARRNLEYRSLELRSAIIQRLAPDFLPVRIIVTSQLPRYLEGGKIDHAWCARMLISGLLEQRANNPVFELLDRLVWSFDKLRQAMK